MSLAHWLLYCKMATWPGPLSPRHPPPSPTGWEVPYAAKRNYRSLFFLLTHWSTNPERAKLLLKAAQAYMKAKAFGLSSEFISPAKRAASEVLSGLVRSRTIGTCTHSRQSCNLPKGIVDLEPELLLQEASRNMEPERAGAAGAAGGTEAGMGYCFSGNRVYKTLMEILKKDQALKRIKSLSQRPKREHHNSRSWNSILMI